MGGLQHKPTPEFLDVWPVWSTLKFVEALPDSRVACVEVHEGMVRPPHASAPRSPAPSRSPQGRNSSVYTSTRPSSPY